MYFVKIDDQDLHLLVHEMWLSKLTNYQYRIIY